MKKPKTTTLKSKGKAPKAPKTMPKEKGEKNPLIRIERLRTLLEKAKKAAQEAKEAANKMSPLATALRRAQKNAPPKGRQKAAGARKER